jgi:hypothetical protein
MATETELMSLSFSGCDGRNRPVQHINNIFQISNESWRLRFRQRATLFTRQMRRFGKTCLRHIKRSCVIGSAEDVAGQADSGRAARASYTCERAAAPCSFCLRMSALEQLGARSVGLNTAIEVAFALV